MVEGLDPRARPSAMTPEAAPLDLSIVIVGRNDGARLARCIRSARSIRGLRGAFEILYVDLESSDGSPARARDMGAAVVSAPGSHGRAAVGRNAGWRAARAPVVMFLGADTVLEPDFVAGAVPLLRDPNVAIVWGHRRELHPEASLVHRILDLDGLHPPGPAEHCGPDALMRRTALEQVEGFDERLGAGEDVELCGRLRALGYRIEHIDQPMTLYDLDVSGWVGYWRHAVLTGYRLAETADRFRDRMPAGWLVAARRNRLHGAGLVLAAGLALGSSLWVADLRPMLVLLALSLALVLRSAGQAVWKEPDPLTRFVYGIHVHLSQIPMLIGQLGYYRERIGGR